MISIYIISSEFVWWWREDVEDVKEKHFGSGWSFDDMFREFDEMRKEADNSFSYNLRILKINNEKI